MSNDGYRHSFSRILAKDFVSTFGNDSSKNYYLFIGKVDPWAGEEGVAFNQITPETATDSREYSNQVCANTLALKRLDSRNISLVVPRYDWTSGTVYTSWSPYEDHDGDAYYVLVDEKRVYKCISNSGNSQSISKPTHTSKELVVEADGYQWKFLYELTERMKEFLTDDYMPVAAASKRLEDETLNQYLVQLQAVDGEIPLVSVSASNDFTWTKTQNTESEFNRTNITSVTLKTVRLNSRTASQVDDYYNGYYLFISDGRGPEIGVCKRIVDYDGTTQTVTLESPLGVPLYNRQGSLPASEYKIQPGIIAHGEGEGFLGLLNTNSAGKASSVYVVDRGSGYRTARLEITTPNDGGSTAPLLVALFGPNGGHGFDATDELNATSVLIRANSDINSVTGNWPAFNDFRQFGIILNPTLVTDSLTADTVIAGDEYDRIIEFEIQKPYDFPYYTYDTSSGTYTPGRYVVGVESNAIGQIYDWRRSTDGTHSILTLKNVKGEFKTSNKNRNEYRFILGTGGSGNFTPGEIIQQYVGTSPNGSTSEGVVLSFETKPTYNELTFIGTTGSFSGSTGSVIGTSGGASYDPIALEVRGGEFIKQFEEFGNTGEYRFVSIANTQNYGRLLGRGDAQIALQNRPTYRTTTKLRVYGSGTYDESYYAEDLGITQEDSSSLVEVTSKIFTHNYIGVSGSNHIVDLYVTDVKGSFVAGNTMELPSVTPEVLSVDGPEVNLIDGSVLYIQNVRPVERSREQEEEFKILLGF